jgi:hypothetical protein
MGMGLGSKGMTPAHITGSPGKGAGGVGAQVWRSRTIALRAATANGHRVFIGGQVLLHGYGL